MEAYTNTHAHTHTHMYAHTRSHTHTHAQHMQELYIKIKLRNLKVGSSQTDQNCSLHFKTIIQKLSYIKDGYCARENFS